MVLGDFDGNNDLDAICWKESVIDIILNINSRQGKMLPVGREGN